MFLLSLSFFALAITLLYIAALLGHGVLIRTLDGNEDSSFLFIIVFLFALAFLCLSIPAYGLIHLVFAALL